MDYIKVNIEEEVFHKLFMILGYYGTSNMKGTTDYISKELYVEIKKDEPVLIDLFGENKEKEYYFSQETLDNSIKRMQQKLNQLNFINKNL